MLVQSRSLLVLAVSAWGCVPCQYDFTHPSGPKTKAELSADMDGCYEEATAGRPVPTASKPEQRAAARAWAVCMRQRGYQVVKR